MSHTHKRSNGSDTPTSTNVAGTTLHNHGSNYSNQLDDEDHFDRELKSRTKKERSYSDSFKKKKKKKKI